MGREDVGEYFRCVEQVAVQARAARIGVSMAIYKCAIVSRSPNEVEQMKVMPTTNDNVDRAIIRRIASN